MKIQTYFRKIGFPKILELIYVLSIFIGKKSNQNIHLSLEYCHLLLKCFKQMTKNYPSFHKLLEADYMDYIDLITTSLETVHAYLEHSYYIKFRTHNEIDKEKLEKYKKSEGLYLNIIYDSANSFLYLIEHCFLYLIEIKKISFAHLKVDLKKIMDAFIKLYENISEARRKLEFHIFYTYLVSRVLKILNRDKAYDNYNYEDFYKEIFNFTVIKERINECIKEISRENENEERSLSQSQSNNNDNNINNDSSYKSKSKEDLIFNENILFLNFLTIYTIYLNELNSIKQSAVEKNIKSQKIKFDALINKINSYLDTSVGLNEYNDFQFQQRKDSIVPDKVGSNIRQLSAKKVIGRKNSVQENLMNFNPNNIKIYENPNKSHEGISRCVNDYNFEIVILRSVVYYKYDKNLVEIKIEMNKRPYFLYYDSEFIDILLLEKILKEMNLEKRLQILFRKSKELTLEDYSLRKLIEEKYEFNSIMQRANQEKIFSQILHDQYIESNMLKYLDNLIKYKFNQYDFETIDIMKYFNYTKLNEMYNENMSNKKENTDVQSRNIKAEKYLTLQEKFIKEDKARSKLIPNFNSRIDHLLHNVRYMYQQCNTELSKLIFKSTFDLIFINSRALKNNDIIVTKEPEFEKIIENLINLFRIDQNKEIVKNSYIFFNSLKSISALLTILKKERKGFINKYSDLIRTFFSNLDFIFDHLSRIIEKIVKFMNNPESHTKFSKFNKKVKKLKKMMKFITNIVKFNNIKDLNILTEKMKSFNSQILEKIMRLIKILLKFNNPESNPTIILLIDFINNFIHGPDIENLKLIFNLTNNSFFDLVRYVIKEIDYYKLILANINNYQIYDRIDTIIEIEYKIMQIFFIFYNIIHNDKGDKYICMKVRHFYEEQIESIKNKMKKIYYIFKVEMRNKGKVDIDQMLLYYIDQDFYTDDDLDIKCGNIEKKNFERNEKNDFHNANNNEKKKEKNKTFVKNKKGSENNNLLKLENLNNINNNNNNNHKTNDRYIIKFELILIYYTLFILHKEVISENYFNIIIGTKGFLSEIYDFFVSFFSFTINMITLPVHLMRLIYVGCGKTNKNRKRKAIFNKLYDINEKYMKINENEMLEFMKEHITSVEINIDDILYKVYFPILTKSQQIKFNRTKYITVNSNELENYIYHIMNNYDAINTELTENHRVDQMLEVPILRYIFLNMTLF